MPVDVAREALAPTNLHGSDCAKGFSGLRLYGGELFFHFATLKLQRVQNELATYALHILHCANI